MKKITLFTLFLALTLAACKNATPTTTDAWLIKNGTIYDGSGGEPFVGDVLIQGDTIAAIEKAGILAKNVELLRGAKEMDATGMAVSPGFVNMLSWATESLIEDGRSLSDIRQGITFEVMGEGESMGPISDSLKLEAEANQSDIKYKIEWTTLGGYLNWLTKRGIACNVGSFVGATTVRQNVLGSRDVAPNPAELTQMKALVRQAMEEGALGVGSSLIYAPAFYAKTNELVELSKVASEYGGSYITHMRSEGNRLLEGVDEVLEIAKRANIHVEIYHLKAAGKQNWAKMDKVIAKIDSARKVGINITTDMYTYVAGATGLDAAMPPSIQEGGIKAWITRLEDPKIRAQTIKDMRTPTDKWENLFLGATPKGMLLTDFKQDSLRYLQGKTLEEVAKIYGKSAEETAMDLVIKDGSRVGVVYFLMSEENVKKQIALPFMSFGSDAASQAPEGVFVKTSAHPRTYGNFARLLGKYVRDEKVITLQEAIRKLAALPCDNLKIKKRGTLKVGNYADVVLFDPLSIQDHATFEKPHQLATGVRDVFVNGQVVLKNGESTGAKAGRVIRGAGFKQ
jgi:N-acyl-D-amino-acid deacylase